MKNKTIELSTQAIQTYNSLIDVQWCTSQITYELIKAATRVYSLKRSELLLALNELESLGLLLVGMEDSDNGLIRTYTPIIPKFGAYGFPYDDFTYEEWQAFKLAIVP